MLFYTYTLSRLAAFTSRVHVHVHVCITYCFIVCVKEVLNGGIFSLWVNTSWKIEYVKAMIEDKEGIPPDYQRLIFAGKPFDDDMHTLNHYNVVAGSTLHMVWRSRHCE